MPLTKLWEIRKKRPRLDWFVPLAGLPSTFFAATRVSTTPAHATIAMVLILVHSCHASVELLKGVTGTGHSIAKVGGGPGTRKLD